MKKTLVAVAAFAAVTGAMADVAITGQIDTGLVTDSFTGGTTDGHAQGFMGVQGDSFITFSGSEALESGWKANFKLEQAIALNSGTSASLFSSPASGNNNREAWVGLSGDFGSLNVGNQYAPLFLTTIAADPMGANNLYGALGNLGLSAVLGNHSIVYTSPSLGGATVSVMENYGANDTGAGTANAGNAYGFSINYANGPLAAGYARHEATFSGTTTQTLVDLAAGGISSGTSGSVITGSTMADGDTITGQGFSLSYDLGAAKLGYWASQKDYSNADQVKGQSVAVSVPFGALSFAYSAGTGSTKVSTTTTSYTGYQYQVAYALSKRTSAFLTGGQMKDTTNDEIRSQYGIGIHHSF